MCRALTTMTKEQLIELIAQQERDIRSLRIDNNNLRAQMCNERVQDKDLRSKLRKAKAEAKSRS